MLTGARRVLEFGTFTGALPAILDAPIRRLNGAHTPTPYSPPLEKAVVPSPEAIAQAIRDLAAE